MWISDFCLESWTASVRTDNVDTADPVGIIMGFYGRNVASLLILQCDQIGVHVQGPGAQAALLWNPYHFPGPLVLTTGGKGRGSKQPAWKLQMFLPFPLMSLRSGIGPTPLQEDPAQDQAEN